jgi:hypothetical protein
MPFKDELSNTIKALEADYKRLRSQLNALCLTPYSVFGEAVCRLPRIVADLKECSELLMTLIVILEQVQRGESINPNQFRLIQDSRYEVVVKLCEDCGDELTSHVIKARFKGI